MNSISNVSISRYLAIMFFLLATSGCATHLGPEAGENDYSYNETFENTTEVTYGNSGFRPKTVTIEKNETVVWESNNSGMWVASNEHPIHTEYSDTELSKHCQRGTGNNAFDQCTSGDRYYFTFEKEGTWEYHNHLDTSAEGKVIVE